MNSQDMSIVHLVLQASWVVQLVMLVLVWLAMTSMTPAASAPSTVCGSTPLAEVRPPPR